MEWTQKDVETRALALMQAEYPGSQRTDNEHLFQTYCEAANKEFTKSAMAPERVLVLVEEGEISLEEQREKLVNALAEVDAKIAKDKKKPKKAKKPVTVEEFVDPDAERLPAVVDGKGGRAAREIKRKTPSQADAQEQA